PQRGPDALRDGGDRDRLLRQRLVAPGGNACAPQLVRLAAPADLAAPPPRASVSVLSQIARGAFPAGSPGSAGYYLVQGFTLAILVLAANTSYQGFPRLAALLARDRVLPSPLVKLVY